MKRKHYILVGVVLLALGAWWWYKNRPRTISEQIDDELKEFGGKPS